MARLILAEVPSGFVLQDEERTDTGPVDLEKAVFDDVALDGEQALRRARFVRGYQRTWTSSSGLDKNTVLLYEFATPQGALSFVDHWLVTLTAGADGIEPEVFEPAFVPNGYGVSLTAPGFSTAAVIAAQGRFAVQAISDGSSGENQQNAAAALAGAQLNRIPA